MLAGGDLDELSWVLAAPRAEVLVVWHAQCIGKGCAWPPAGLLAAVRQLSNFFYLLSLKPSRNPELLMTD